jgi:hypothetical protein
MQFDVLQMFFMKQSHFSSYKNIIITEEKQPNGMQASLEIYIYDCKIAFVMIPAT